MDSKLKDEWLFLWKKSSGGVYQNLSFAEIEERCGKKLVPITLYKEEALKAGIMMAEREINSFGIKKKILQANGDPIYEDRSSFLELLKKIRGIKGYYYITIAPFVLSKDEKSFIDCGYKKIENSTILIDLKKNKEDLWNSLEKKSIRWGIKTAEKNGLKFEAANQNDLIKFYEMYEATARKGGFEAEREDFIKCLRDCDFSKLFVVKQGNLIVSGGLILVDKNNKIATLDLTGASDDGLKLQAMPFLYWNIILYSKNQGLNYFDLGGYDSEAKEGDKTYNINKYKERFGGEVVCQNVYSTNYKYYLIRKLMRKARFLKKIYKKS